MLSNILRSTIREQVIKTLCCINIELSLFAFLFLFGLGVFCIYLYLPVADLLITDAVIYWPCQPVDLSVIPTSVMMATYYRSCILFVLVCTVNPVISSKITGTITKNFDNHATEVEVSEYINGDNWGYTTAIHLNKLVDGETLPTLTLTNLRSLIALEIINISLEHVPVFANITTDYMSITATKIKHVPTNAFSGAQVRRLVLDNNEIQSMADRSVNADVQHLYLRCNKLSDFSQDWFKVPGNILILDLSGNRIEYIQHQAFNQMTKLYELLLGFNHITRIDSEAFSAEITNLYLHFNGIEHLTPHMFAVRYKPIYYLFLHHNQLSFLSEALLLKSKPAHITLDGNPWQCQCLGNIERWIRELNIKQHYLRDRRDEPVCVMPRSFQNLCVPTVDKELQQTYARGLSPVPECLASACKPCSDLGLDIILG